MVVFSVKTEDYFDGGIMERLQDQLNAITSRTEIDINGSSSTITFHSSVSRIVHDELPENLSSWFPTKSDTKLAVKNG